MELKISEKSLVCIDYPGIVLNPDKALETLDGLKNLKKTLSDPTKRIPLTFRPGDSYCKPAFGDPTTTTSLLIKIRRRRININNNNNINNNSNDNNNNNDNTEVNSNNNNNTNNNSNKNALIGEILGVVDRTVVFKSLCDYQYLPMERQSYKPQTPIFQAPNHPTNCPLPTQPPQSFTHPQTLTLTTTPSSTQNINPSQTTFNHLNTPQSNQTTSQNSLFQPIPLNPSNLLTTPIVSYKSLHKELFLEKLHTRECLPNSATTTPITTTSTPSPIITTTTTVNSTATTNPNPTTSNPNISTTTNPNLTTTTNPNLTTTDSPDPLFLLPIFFSRFDQPYLYCFRDAQTSKKFFFPENCVGISRSRRPRHTTVIKFSSTHLPTTPPPQTHDKISKAKIPEWKIMKVEAAFAHKKVWTSLALYAEVGPDVTKNNLKLILPSLAYYYVDGPWRSMWVFYGYDCKKEKECKIYQNLDFRLERGRMSLYTGVKSKRSAFSNKLQNRSTTSFDDFEEEEDEGGGDDDDDDGGGGEGSGGIEEQLKKFKKEVEPSYIFKPGVLPLHKQTFYHLCHIHEPEVQRLVHLNDGQESFCTEKDGWCLPDTIDKCRAIINSYRRKVVSKHLKASDSILTQGGGDDDEEDEEDEEEDDVIFADGNDTSYGYGNVDGGDGGAGNNGGDDGGDDNDGGKDNTNAYRTTKASGHKPNPPKDDDDDEDDDEGDDDDDDDDEYIP